MTTLSTPGRTTLTGDWAPPVDARTAGLGTSLLAGVLAGVLLMAPGAWLIRRDWVADSAERAARAERITAHARLAAAPAEPVLDVPTTAHGRDLFITVCAACHGAGGAGMPGLGKDLTTSWFVASSDDASLRRLITFGRSPLDSENTTRVLMPAKGGRPDLTEGDVSDVAVYVRGLQDPRRMPALPEPKVLVAAVTEEDKTKALAAAGGDAELAEFIAHGTKVFAATCSACHGKDARGIQGQGKNLITSEFCRKLDDDGLLAFVKRGRDPNDPLNTTKVAMPPKGGNPALSDDDLLDVISYVRSLQKQGTP